MLSDETLLECLRHRRPGPRLSLLGDLQGRTLCNWSACAWFLRASAAPHESAGFHRVGLNCLLHANSVVWRFGVTFACKRISVLTEAPSDGFEPGRH
jgi:hypothetical protein